MRFRIFEQAYITMAKFLLFSTSCIILINITLLVKLTASLGNAFALTMWSTWPSILLMSLYYIFGSKGAFYQYPILAAFVGVSGFNLSMIIEIASLAWTMDSVGGFGPMFMIMPFGFVKYGGLGFAVGFLVYIILFLRCKLR